MGFSQAGVMGRRPVLALLGGGLALPFGRGSAVAAQSAPLKFIYGTQEGSVSTLPLLIAQGQGYLAGEQLDVEYVFSPSSNATAAALASGEIGLCARVVTAVIAMRDKGIDARLIAAVTPRSDYNILVGTGSKVPAVGQDGATWQDTIRALKGATIATNGPGSPIDLQIQAYFTGAGLSAQDFTGVAIGEGAAQVAALTAGTVDAVAYTTLVARLVEQRGVGKVVLSFADAGPELVSNMASIGVTATDQFLARTPDFGDRYRRAIGRALAYMQNPANIDAVTKVAVANGQAVANPEIDRFVAELVRKYSVTFTVKEIQNAIDFAKSIGALDKGSRMTPQDITEPQALA